MQTSKNIHTLCNYNKISTLLFKRCQSTTKINNTQINENVFNKFSSKGPFSNIPKLEKSSQSDSSLILKLPPLSTYYISSLNFSGIIQEKNDDLSKTNKNSPWYKTLFSFKKTKAKEEDSINLELLSDNTHFQKISTLNKATNILINLFSNTTSTLTLSINYKNSYTILNPNENLLSYSENITRISSGKNVETVGGVGIVTLISKHNFQHIIKEKNQELIFEAARLIGFVNNSKLKFEWTNLDGKNKVLFGNPKKYLKCTGEGEIILQK